MEDRQKTEESTRRRFIRNCAALGAGAFAGTALWAGVAGGTPFPLCRQGIIEGSAITMGISSN